MTSIKWSKDLETGIACIDADHKVLVSLLNQVEDCAEQHEESMVLGSVFATLVEYTDYHFAREERLQELCGYSGLANHKAEHGKLASQAHNHHGRYMDDSESFDVLTLKDFLSEWLVKHIMVGDFAFRSVCIGNQAAIDEVSAISIINGHGAETAPLDWKRLSILLIDDNPNFRHLIKTILKAVGVRNLRLAASAEEGLEMLVKKPSDIVLCDWVMDGMDGAQLTRKLRQFDDSSKVVLVTGHAIEKYRSQAAAAGVNGFLQKPITVAKLLEAIAKAAE